MVMENKKKMNMSQMHVPVVGQRRWEFQYEEEHLLTFKKKMRVVHEEVASW